MTPPLASRSKRDPEHLTKAEPSSLSRKTHTSERSRQAAPSRDLEASGPAVDTVKRFRAVLEPDHTSLKWTVARVPFNASSVWPRMLRRRVAGTINGAPFRTALFPAGSTGAQILLVNKGMQAAANAYLGDKADFELWPDLANRSSDLPSELLTAFDGDKALHRWTLDLSDSTRREIGKWIGGVKSPESRSRRAAQMAERLLLAMEGERETPPILEAAFRAHPRARAGWVALTPHQRRSHLLGIFYYQTPEARSRRAQKAVEEAMKAAEQLQAATRPDQRTSSRKPSGAGFTRRQPSPEDLS